MSGLESNDCTIYIHVIIMSSCRSSVARALVAIVSGSWFDSYQHHSLSFLFIRI